MRTRDRSFITGEPFFTYSDPVRSYFGHNTADRRKGGGGRSVRREKAKAVERKRWQKRRPTREGGSRRKDRHEKAKCHGCRNETARTRTRAKALLAKLCSSFHSNGFKIPTSKPRRHVTYVRCNQELVPGGFVTEVVERSFVETREKTPHLCPFNRSFGW